MSNNPFMPSLSAEAAFNSYVPAASPVGPLATSGGGLSSLLGNVGGLATSALSMLNPATAALSLITGAGQMFGDSGYDGGASSYTDMNNGSIALYNSSSTDKIVMLVLIGIVVFILLKGMKK